MAYYKDFHEYLQALDKRGKLTRIKRPINKDTELHPLAKLQFRGLPEEQRMAFLFENVVDSNGRKYDIPVATSALAGSDEIYAIGLMCTPEEISDKLTNAELHPIPPRLVAKAPVQEEVYMGKNLEDAGGLGKFPIPVTTPGFDASPYITAPYWVSKDPDSGIHNIGMYRAMVKSPIKTGVMLMSHRQGTYIHWNKCKQRGKPLEAAMVIGGPPSLGYVSVSKYPVDMDEFGIAGGIAGEPLEVVKCKSIDLNVPAHADVIIEGELDTKDIEMEAPFGEAHSFVGMPEHMPCFNVKCITQRHKPVWVTTVSQYPPSESSKMRQYANESIIFKTLRYDLGMKHVLGVSFFDALGSSNMFVIKVGKTEPAEVMRTLQAASDRYYAKICVIVDEDINIRDLDSVIMAICVRAQPQRDFHFIKGISNRMDFSEVPIGAPRKDTEASRVLIDTTMKWPFPPLSIPKKEFMEKALHIWQEIGLPPLKLKEPWWGVNLGYWNEELENLAKSATEGDYYKAGSLYSNRKRPV